MASVEKVFSSSAEILYSVAVHTEKVYSANAEVLRTTDVHTEYVYGAVVNVLSEVNQRRLGPPLQEGG